MCWISSNSFRFGRINYKIGKWIWVVQYIHIDPTIEKHGKISEDPPLLLSDEVMEDIISSDEGIKKEVGMMWTGEDADWISLLVITLLVLFMINL